MTNLHTTTAHGLPEEKAHGLRDMLRSTDSGAFAAGIEVCRSLAMSTRSVLGLIGFKLKTATIPGGEHIIGSPADDPDRQADEAIAMADVNFTGLVRVLGQIVPQMTERDNGHIVITGSLAGFRGLRNSIGYGASKAGTMVMAESLYADLWRTGVRVQLANPGFIRTRLTDKNDFKMPALMEPDAAAQKMFEHMNSTRFRMSFPSPFAWVFRIAQLLPDAIYYRLFA